MNFFTTLLGAFCVVCRCRVTHFQEICDFCAHEMLNNLKAPNVLQYLKYQNESHIEENVLCISVSSYKGWVQNLILNQKRAPDASVVRWMGIRLQDTLIRHTVKDLNHTMLFIPPRPLQAVHLVEYLQANLEERGWNMTRDFRIGWQHLPFVSAQKSRDLQGRLKRKNPYTIRGCTEDLAPDTTIILIDDVVTTGTTLIQAIDAIRKHGLSNTILALTFAAAEAAPDAPVRSPYIVSTKAVISEERVW